MSMRELTVSEIDFVSGGDSWAGTPEGRAPAGGGDSGGNGDLFGCVVGVLIEVLSGNSGMADRFCK